MKKKKKKVEKHCAIGKPEDPSQNQLNGTPFRPLRVGSF